MLPTWTWFKCVWALRLSATAVLAIIERTANNIYGRRRTTTNSHSVVKGLGCEMLGIGCLV